MDRIRRELHTRRIARRVEWVSSTATTNDDAWHGLGDGAGDGATILAEYQSAGRGRFGREWESPRGASLLCSVGIREETDTLTGAALGLVAAVAASSAIASSTGILASIRWPNDLMASGRKLGGVLVESRRLADRGLAFVVGVGINCLQQRGHFAGALSDTATSLELESCDPVDRTSLAISYLTELDGWLSRCGAWTQSELQAAWAKRCESIGSRIALTERGTTHRGTVIDIDPLAALVVQLDEGGIRRFDAAECTAHVEDQVPNP